MMTSEAADRLSEEIEKAANIVAQRWPEVIEADDVAQDIGVKLLESPMTTRELMAKKPQDRINILVGLGNREASRALDDYDRFTGRIYYSTDDVRGLLKKGQLAGAEPTTESERLDLENGFASLAKSNPRYAQLLWSEFVNEDLDKETGHIRKELTRAIDALTRLMNRSHNGRSID